MGSEMCIRDRSRGTRTLTTPPPPQTPEPPKEQTANTSSDSGASFTVLGSWNEDQHDNEARWEPQRPVNVVAPSQRQDAALEARQEDSDGTAPIIL